CTACVGAPYRLTAFTPQLKGREELMNDFDGLVTSDNLELAQLFNKHRNKDRARTMQAMARRKMIPAKKIGGGFYFHITSLKTWIANQFADQLAMRADDVEAK